MLSRDRFFLRTVDGAEAPSASHDLERDGYAVVRGVLDDAEVARLHAAVTRVFDETPPEVRSQKNEDEHPGHYDQFRYEMCNRSAVVRELVADPRILSVLEPLLGEDCHVIANTAWRNPAHTDHVDSAGNWHLDAGPHVPRPRDVPWDDRIPYPVFAVGIHVLLEDCPVECGPTEVVPGSHRTGRAMPFSRMRDDDLDLDGRRGVALTGRAGDVAMFTSDAWHRRGPTLPGDTGRFFVQAHYGRRDIAQRLRPTALVNHLSEDALEGTRAGSDRARTVLGLHDPLFYDA